MSLIAATWFQMLCCFRVSRGNLQCLIVLSVATGVLIVCSAMFIEHDWGPYFLVEFNQAFLLVTCIISGIMWIILAFKVVFFLDGGDYARLEQLLDAAAARQENRYDFYNESDDDNDANDDYDVETGSVEIPQESRETNHAIRVLIEQRDHVDLEALSLDEEMISIALDSLEATTQEESDPDEDCDREPIEARRTVEVDSNDGQVEIHGEEREEHSHGGDNGNAVIETNAEVTPTAARESTNSSMLDDSSRRRRSMALEINRAGQIFHVSRSFTGEPGERNDG